MTTHNNSSVKEGTTASAKKLFRKSLKQKSDENEIQVLERFDHPQMPDVHENKQVRVLLLVLNMRRFARSETIRFQGECLFLAYYQRILNKVDGYNWLMEKSLLIRGISYSCN